LKNISRCLLILISLMSTTAMAEMTMLGVAEDGSEIETTIPESRYKEQLKKALHSVQDSTLAVLQRNSVKAPSWLLRTVVVGLGLKMEFGVGPIVQVGVLPRFRLAFTNNKEPSVP
jgi:hypothetical protein